MYLLLLPALAPPVKRSSWWAAYKLTIDDVLKQLQPSTAHETTRLDIAVIFTSTFTDTTQRTTFYKLFQDVLREVYSLLWLSAAHVKVELDFPGGIDARVFMLNARDLESSRPVETKQYSGPIVDWNTLAEARRPYRAVFTVDCEAGEAAAQSLLRLWRDRSISPEIRKLRCGISIAMPSETSKSVTANSSNQIHKNVINGGTFDHLHIGHKLLLAATVYLADPDDPGHPTTQRKIYIGITGDELLVNKKHAGLVESWEERQHRTAEFIESILVFHPDVSKVRTVQEFNQPGPNGKVVRIIYGGEVEINYTRISDPYGPTITVEPLTAIIISAETRSGGKAVNDRRIEKGWHPLDVFEVDVLDAEVQDDYGGTAAEGASFENKISSTDIRRRLEAKARSSNGHL